MKNIQYYSHLCACGCNGEIEIKRHHKWKGIPKYLLGHSISYYKHGEKGSKLYMVWQSMKQRILNLNHKSYKNYGGRGITICPEWIDSYIIFRDWSLRHGYQEGLEIDRRDNDKGYSPENCRWITKKENTRNTRYCKINKITAKEIRDKYIPYKYTAKMLAKEYNLNHYYIYNIINNKTWCEE